jgi:hypothetical protein
MPSSRPLIVAAVVIFPLGVLAFAGGLSAGCGPDKPDAKTPVADAVAVPGSADGGTPMVVDAAPEVAADVGGNMWTVDAAPEASVATADAAPPPPCWKGFTTTGNAVADLNDLASRCTQGMTPVFPPVKQVFKQGEVKTIPVPFVPACYRIIAVGGTGLKDVDLELKDSSGKMVAADNTPNDIFPMIHPNKEFCVDAVSFLNLSIIVKKGTGEVAGGVWKR